MSLRLRPGEPASQGVRRVAADQIAKAVEQLTEQPDGEACAVHEARKRFKKARALLRLIKDELPQEDFQRDNSCFRDAGRLLAGARDAFVLAKTARALEQSLPDERSREFLGDFRRRMRSLDTHSESLADPAAIAAVLRMLRSAHSRIDSWIFRHEDFEAIGPGLRRSYRRGRRRMIEACLRPSPERFHAWRKRCKDLWYQARLMRAFLPHEMSEWPARLHTLSELLGDHHDLMELRRTIEADRMSSEAVRSLNQAIGHRCRRLEIEARAIGEEIYREKPKRLVDSLASQWASLREPQRVA